MSEAGVAEDSVGVGVVEVCASEEDLAERPVCGLAVGVSYICECGCVWCVCCMLKVGRQYAVILASVILASAL